MLQDTWRQRGPIQVALAAWMVPSRLCSVIRTTTVWSQTDRNGRLDDPFTITGLCQSDYTGSLDDPHGTVHAIRHTFTISLQAARVIPVKLSHTTRQTGRFRSDCRAACFADPCLTTGQEQPRPQSARLHGELFQHTRDGANGVLHRDDLIC